MTGELFQGCKLSQGPCIDYFGVDLLDNAVICNEVGGLRRTGLRLEAVSVPGFTRPTFYQEEVLPSWGRLIEYLTPLRFSTVVCDLARAPLAFGGRSWATFWGELSESGEGPRQKLSILWHVIPSLRLAFSRQAKSIRHIHAHRADAPTTIAMHTARLLGMSFSFTRQANDLFVRRVGLTDKVRRARLIVCVSEFHRRFYLERGAKGERPPVVYRGIDLDRFVPTPDLETVPRIVAVGRLVADSGLADLIRACAELRRQRVAFECLIAGSGPDESVMKALIDRLGLGDRVSATAANVSQEDRAAPLRMARVVAHP
jgi:glycosyltransferase involved in cell wall biosynthesis